MLGGRREVWEPEAWDRDAAVAELAPYVDVAVAVIVGIVQGGSAVVGARHWVGMG